MLGFLRGLEQGVAREGAAQRQHHSTVLSRKENHLDRLLAQIKYNQQMKYRQVRDARQDFVTDRSYKRGVLESDRTHQYRQDRATAADKQFDAMQALRERADTRAGEVHTFNYGDDGYMRQRAEREGEIHDFNYGEGGYRTLQRRQLENEIEEWDENATLRGLTRQYLQKKTAYDMGLGLDTRAKQDALTREQYTAYLKDAPVRDLNRRHLQKLGEYNLGQGWQEFLENQSLQQDLTRAQIGAYNRRGTTSTGRSGGPTWSQTKDITVENLAPVVLQHLKDEGESAVWPWDKQAQFWPPGFQADRPFVSENPNEWTQTKGLRQAGAHLVEELILRGVDPNTAMQMVPVYWDQILDSKGSDVLKRLNRSSQAAGYDTLEMRKIYRDMVYEGAMNYMRFKQPNRPAGATTDDADKLLDSITIE